MFNKCSNKPLTNNKKPFFKIKLKLSNKKNNNLNKLPSIYLFPQILMMMFPKFICNLGQAQGDPSLPFLYKISVKCLWHMHKAKAGEYKS